jgi:hypothetical protein
VDSDKVGPAQLKPAKKKRPALKAAFVVSAIIVVALLLLTPAAQGFLRDLVSSPFRERYPASATFTLDRSMLINANGGEVMNYSFDISIPSTISQNGYTIQSVSSISYSPGVSTTEQKYGQTWVTWNGSPFSGYHTRELKATFQMTVYTHIWEIDKTNSLTTADIPSSYKTQYLHDEWKIEMTDPMIVSQSQAIVGGETNVYQILKNIYDWMTVNIEYPTVLVGGDPQSANYTLTNRVGDCDDQSILFCALARAAGVPAWLQMGALMVTAENSWGGHGWLEAYIPTTSGGDKVTIDVVNKDFLLFRPNRFIDYTDDGNADHLADYYYTIVVSYNDTKPIPTFSEQYVALDYQESSEKITKGTVYFVDQLILGDSSRATIRI